jgi:uncharacterized protein (UPF0335 family)
MTDKQSEALRLADALDLYLSAEWVHGITLKHISDELRRLDALNAELVEALNNIIEEPKNTMSDNKALREIVRITKAALAKAEGK